MDLKDYIYHLPEERIAKYPLKDRSAAKMLHYNKGQISHHIFKELPNKLPDDSLLFFNNTKVIPARLFFSKDTGALIEIFLLEPLKPHTQRELAMEANSPVQWRCMIRNLKKWKNDDLSLKLESSTTLTATLISREEQIVELTWTGKNTFAELLEVCGRIPLPPYMNREATEEDNITYQTVYAQLKGAVAAPTAGLHFTPEIIEALKDEVKMDYLTLHVSAGTFQPIKTDDYKAHDMHEEEVIVSKNNLLNIINHQGKIIPVGTTSMRTLESTYWYGVQLLMTRNTDFNIEKLFPYGNFAQLPARKEAFKAVLDHLEKNEMENIIGKTSIYIFPGYRMKVCDGLITNFHLPGSTLILLIAALVGESWKKIYEEALSNNYRFLSYGDSSLLIP